MWTIGFVTLTVVTIVPLFCLRRQDERGIDYCEIIYPVVLYLYVGMGVRGALLCSGLEQTPYQEVYEILQSDRFAALYTFLVAAIGVACLYAGYFLPRRHKWATSAGRSRALAGPHSFRVMYSLSLVYGLLAAIATFYLWRTYGGPGTLGFEPDALIHQSTEGGMYIFTGWSRLAFIGTLVSAGLVARRGGGIAWAVCLLNIGAVLFWFLISSGKESLLLLVLGILIVRHYLTKRVSLRSLIFAAVAVLYLYPVLVGYRYAGSMVFRGPLPEYYAGSRAFIERSHQFDLALLAVNDVNGLEDLKYGSTLAELGYFYIPRAVWPSKPMSFGYRFGEEYTPQEFQLGQTGGETPSLIGELFLNFHVLGVAFGMFLFGWWLKSNYIFLGSGAVSSLKACTYALFVLDAMAVVEGPIASHMTTFVVDAAPILVMGILAARGVKGLSPARRRRPVMSPVR